MGSFDDIVRDMSDFDSFSELSDEVLKEDMVSVVSILPDDLLERILAYLPVSSAFRVGCVCKRWYKILSSRTFLWDISDVQSQKPWYFMFTSTEEPVGYAYDPILRKWYGIELPCIRTSSWFIASSCGLVCFIDNDSRNELYLCNPITRHYRKLEEPPGSRLSDCGALALSVNKVSPQYCVCIVKSKQVAGDFNLWELSVHVYDSGTVMWTTPLAENVAGWRGGDEICNGVLYLLIYSAGGGVPENRHGLLTYSLSSRLSHGLLMRNFSPLTCGRLMNLKEKLVMVGGTGKQDRPGIIRALGSGS